MHDPITKPLTAPYGSWKSPISADLVVSGSISLSQLSIDKGMLYWLETRPNEGGRTTIMQRTPSGENIELLPAPYDVRTRVHEYGGGAYLVQDRILYFSNFQDQRIYRMPLGEEPDPITPGLDLRYADFRIDPFRNLLYSVREDHTMEGEAVNTLVTIDLQAAQQYPQAGKVIVSGNDFYSNPRLSPDSTKLAWLTWNHPNMPWDGTELWVAEINPDGRVGEKRLVAGGLTESIFQPEWSPDGVLYFVSDRTGWWNLYRWKENLTEALYPLEAEFGLPQWVFGARTFDFVSAERLIYSYLKDGRSHLGMMKTRTLEHQEIEAGYPDIRSVRATNEIVYYLGGSPTEPLSIIGLDLITGKWKILRQPGRAQPDRAYFSIPEEIRFSSSGENTSYGFYYPPHNPDFSPPEGELPPLIVMSHGGPTGSTSTTYDLGIQYLTSRGLAVLDVNYSGSTDYGRAYRERLKGNWGILDVDDCVNGALYLAEQGWVDPDRMAITGGSAGGYTTLSALAFRDVFRAGASYYGIGDLEALARDTHKFESHYLDRLIGPYPEKKELYIQRSPIHYTKQLNSALIIFQGAEDRVVSPKQAEMMYQAVLDKGLPVAYLLFKGEGHGFRMAQNMKRALEAELYFYSHVFGFQLADEVEPVEIQNLPE
jgi:dipeptidyl aminopeptidase/acylaminoacyl peptidase